MVKSFRSSHSNHFLPMTDSSIERTSDSPIISLSHIDNEALRHRFNPDGSPLRKHQLRMLEMLRFLDMVCRKNDIPYWLSSGSCLGAVRHGGFIPWDDDVDVEILSEDYPRLIKAIEAEHSDRYVLQTHENDPFWLQRFPKLRDLHSEIDEGKVGMNYRYKGMFIDIFLMEPAVPKWIGRIGQKLVWICVFHGCRLYRGTKTDRLVAAVSWGIMSAARRVVKTFSRTNKEGRMTHRYPNHYIWPRYKSDIFPLRECEFENLKVFVPGDTHSYLTRIFGDYSKLPSTDNIVTHCSGCRYFDEP